ncbi:MAG: serine dehydratase beta chain, partial [Fimbriiglobus sp.]
MNLSVFDLFKIGIGPSSSHTVGPMVAAYRFVGGLRESGALPAVARVGVDLYGSLALTGKGHATDKAVILGLSGEKPDTVDADHADAIVDTVRGTGKLRLGGDRPLAFAEPRDLRFHRDEFLPAHPNGVRFTAHDDTGAVLVHETYFSVGGGFVVKEGETAAAGSATPIPYDFGTAAELLAIGQRTGLKIPEILAANEAALRPPADTAAGLDRIWAVMEGCIERGCRTGGELPGGLGVQRRAKKLYRDLTARGADTDPLAVLDWVSLFALAVNVENAAGGRVVTAPT